MTIPADTIISQYANSQTIMRLIENMADYIDPTADFDNFFNFVWNVDTAQHWGLDILGRIVVVSREFATSSDSYTLDDDAYRALIKLKALSNISDSSVPSINRMLQSMFAGRGRCYVSDTGGMQMRFIFEFALLDYELAILTQSNAIPRPAGVLSTVVQVPAGSNIFGFAGSGLQGFDNGTFLDF